MDFFIVLIQGLLSNLLTPIVLFVVAYLLRNSNAVVTFSSKVYREVQQSYFIVKELDEASEDTEDSHSDNEILRKTSKDYGKYGNWMVRTYYSMSLKQLCEFSRIEFSIKETDTKITLYTKDLLKKVVENREEEVVDSYGKIRIFIFQDKSSKKFYLVRFGKRRFSDPFPLELDKKGNYLVKESKEIYGE
ncbi:hypothetical protein RZ76_04240 [Apilactobacillus kunkeei]|uniref:hypothetical protein n=1 Tax=Apilactobacillus kunkeei TaxID=148814 RepID=UPI0006CE9949|nr:hypothetical protein [Apilactobacillus kunkeei]KPN80233.1 hypothetical protein RZ76_04240 [Apilactobacillus kunkeei]